MTFDDFREIALSFPKVEEYLLFGTPAFRVGKRLLLCPAKVDPDTVMLKVPDKLEREFFLSQKPEVFYLEPHYENYDCLLVRMSLADAAEIRDLFEGAWRTYAPKKVVAAYDAGA